MENLISSFNNYFKSRSKTPLFGIIGIAFILSHWEYVYFTIFTPSTIENGSKLEKLKSLPIDYDLVFKDFITELIIIAVAIPVLSLILVFFNGVFKRLSDYLLKKIDEGRYISIEEKRELINNIAMLEKAVSESSDYRSELVAKTAKHEIYKNYYNGRIDYLADTFLSIHFVDYFNFYMPILKAMNGQPIVDFENRVKNELSLISNNSKLKHGDKFLEIFMLDLKGHYFIEDSRTLSITDFGRTFLTEKTNF